jgi:hypothetical protein
MNMFHIGQPVVCIDADPPPSLSDDCYSAVCHPVRGGIYTIRGFVCPEAYRLTQTPGLVFEELINAPIGYTEGMFEPSFNPRRFRPLVERKTDISLFQAMLKTEELAE